jgi:hypothetical protein
VPWGAALGSRGDVCTGSWRCRELTLYLSVQEMFSANNKQQTSQLWMWRMEYLHHEQRPLYFGEWF